MRRPTCRYDCASDMWSFGMTLLELATGQAPYANLGLDQIMMKTMNDDPPRLESSDRRKLYSEVRPLPSRWQRDSITGPEANVVGLDQFTEV